MAEKENNTEQILTGQNMSIQTVTIKTTVFIASNVIAWFSIMETQFNITNMRQSRQKFYHTLAALPLDIIVKIQTTILHSKDYDILKEAVINSYEKSKLEMLDKLMSSTITRCPSMYLNELMSLAS